MTGMAVRNSSSNGFTASSTSLTSFSSEYSGAKICSRLNPRCPPAIGPSTTNASGRCESFAHFLQSTSAARPEETIGTSLVREEGVRKRGRSSGRPAPQKMKSIASSTAAFTRSA